MGEPARRRALEWGTAARSRRRESISGDLGVVDILADGALVVAVDGLGHGPHAARAARIAVEVVRERADHDLVALVRHSHEALKQTRGAAMSLALLSTSNASLSWLGIGNVEGRLMGGEPTPRGKASLPLLAGLAGHELPPLRPTTVDVRRGDVLIFATDGIEPAFADSLELSGSAQEIAERVLAEHWKATDDALVLAIRYLGDRA